VQTFVTSGGRYQATSGASVHNPNIPVPQTYITAVRCCSRRCAPPTGQLPLADPARADRSGDPRRDDADPHTRPRPKPRPLHCRRTRPQPVAVVGSGCHPGSTPTVDREPVPGVEGSGLFAGLGARTGQSAGQSAV